MNNFNNNNEPQETVRQTLERVWSEKEQQKQPSYAAKNHLARALPRETYIKATEIMLGLQLQEITVCLNIWNNLKHRENIALSVVP